MAECLCSLNKLSRRTELVRAARSRLSQKLAMHSRMSANDTVPYERHNRYPK